MPNEDEEKLDDLYFKYYKKDKNPTICPNEIYVALTRAQEQLIVLHHISNNFLSFIDINLIIIHCYYEEKKIFQVKQGKNTLEPIAVTDLFRHLPSETIIGAMKFVIQ